MRQNNLLKINFYFTILLFFYACTSREERISSIDKEIQVLRDSMAVASKNALELRLLKKAILEDTLHTYLEPLKREIALLNDNILSTEKKFRKDLQIAKDQHFSRFGHHPGGQGSLNKIIDNLIYQKERKVSSYQAEISRLEGSYQNNPYYIEMNQRIVVLDIEWQKENRKINRRFKNKIKMLEDSLASLVLTR